MLKVKSSTSGWFSLSLKIKLQHCLKIGVMTTQNVHFLPVVSRAVKTIYHILKAEGEPKRETSSQTLIKTKQRER